MTSFVQILLFTKQRKVKAWQQNTLPVGLLKIQRIQKIGKQTWRRRMHYHHSKFSSLDAVQTLRLPRDSCWVSPWRRFLLPAAKAIVDRQAVVVGIWLFIYKSQFIICSGWGVGSRREVVNEAGCGASESLSEIIALKIGGRADTSLSLLGGQTI